MFEMARDHARDNTDFQVVGGYLSLVNDAYKKPGLAPSIHRYNMCRLACDKTSDWLMVDPYEARQENYVPTAPVLDHFDEEINNKRNGVPVLDKDGNEIARKKVRIILLAGSDLIQTMSEPGVWAEEDVSVDDAHIWLPFPARMLTDFCCSCMQLHHILGKYGCYIIERAESEIDQSIFSTSSVHSRSPLALYRDNIYMVPQLVRNDVSSTKVRLFVRKGMSIEYLLPRCVSKYIRKHSLYKDGVVARPEGLPESFPPLELSEKARPHNHSHNQGETCMTATSSSSSESSSSESGSEMAAEDEHRND